MSVENLTQIESELQMLISLAELVRARNDPDGVQPGFFAGLGDLIETAADRIKQLLQSSGG